MITTANIQKLYHDFINPRKRVALSIRYPFLKYIIMRIHRGVQYIRRYRNSSYSLLRSNELLPFVVKKHKSVIMRKLGSVDMELQENKKTNLLITTHLLNKTILQPGQKWSFWQHVGLPTYKRGYKDGVLLYQGKVIRGVGGGICQMANLLYWLVLHSPLQVTKHYHHSYDLFPDSGRILPFGSGATVVYNYVDLEFYNPTDSDFQFEIWQDDNFLYGNLRCSHEQKLSYSIVEQEHAFVSTPSGYFRYNQLYKTIVDKTSGNIVNAVHIRDNFSPVLYELSDDNKNSSIQIS